MGQSIISGAVFKGYEEIVQELVAKGADPHQEIGDNWIND